MSKMISSRLDKLSFPTYQFFMDSALSTFSSPDEVVLSALAQTLNGKNKKKWAVFMITKESLIYSISGLTPNNLAIKINNINHVSVKTKLSGTHVNVDTLRGHLNIIFTSAKIAEKFVATLNEMIYKDDSFKSIATGQSNLSQIKELKELLDLDAITIEEYEKKKSELLK